MQHLNDDMDEIFRKAADEYPLNTGTPDWNKVAEGLSQEIIPETPVKKSYRKYRWLLLLLPLGFICNQIYDPGLFKQIINNNEVAENTNNSKEQPNLKDREPGSGDQASALDNNEPGTDKNLGRDKNSGTDKNSNTDKNLDSDKNSGSDKNLVSDSKKVSGQSSKAQKMTAGQPSLSDKQTSNTGDATSRKNKNSGINHNPKTSNPKSSGKAYAGIAINSTVEESPVPDFYEIDPYIKTGLAPFDNVPDVSAIPLPEMTKLTPGPISKQRAKQKNFYVGLVGGIDMTTISFQETSKIGNQYGGLAGYSFAKKWSVEVGFFVERKYYYTDPKYFEKGKLPYRQNSTVLSVDGSCDMFEIPISVKYDITNTYKSNFFVTGGLSSYIMKNEDYSILYLYNSSGSQAHHNYSYKNSTTNLFSQIRITGGYALKLPKSFSVRIEPYFNIPVSGVGHGELNLMSAGINAGIFRRIF